MLDVFDIELFHEDFDLYIVQWLWSWSSKLGAVGADK